MRPALPLSALTATLLVPIMACSATSPPTSGPPAVTPVGATPTPGPAAATPPTERVADPVDLLRPRSTNDPDSIWVVVNKTRPIRPLGFHPDISLVRGYQVAASAADDLTRLMDTSDRRGLGLKIASAFRSHGYQQRIYDAQVATLGRAEADKLTARPGHSEHQTGLAVDLVTPDDLSCNFEACFARQRAGQWLAEQSWKFGFIVRYTPGHEAVTGFSPEPWHLRYVGRELAAAMHAAPVRPLETVLGVLGGDYGSAG